MENITSQQFELRLSQTAADYLKESAKWSFFLAIVGFIGIGFMVLLAVFMSTFMSSMAQNPAMGVMGQMQGMLSAIYILFAVLYAFPIYYLYKYATDAKTALVTANSDLLETALGYLKSHHKFLGIMMIVILSLYALIFIGAIGVGIFAAV